MNGIMVLQILDLVAFKSRSMCPNWVCSSQIPVCQSLMPNLLLSGFHHGRLWFAFSPFVLLRALGEPDCFGQLSPTPTARAQTHLPVSSGELPQRPVSCCTDRISESRRRHVYLAISKVRKPETEPETSGDQIQLINPNSTPKTKLLCIFRIKKK